MYIPDLFHLANKVFSVYVFVPWKTMVARADHSVKCYAHTEHVYNMPNLYCSTIILQQNSILMRILPLGELQVKWKLTLLGTELNFFFIGKQFQENNFSWFTH